MRFVAGAGLDPAKIVYSADILAEARAASRLGRHRTSRQFTS